MTLLSSLMRANDELAPPTAIPLVFYWNVHSLKGFSPHTL